MQKILLVLIGVVYLQLTIGRHTSENDLRPSQNECLKELNLSADVLLNGFNNEDFTAIEGNKDFNSICVCTFRKEDFLKDDDNMLNLDKYKDFLITEYFTAAKLNFDNSTEAALNGLNACKSVKESDIGDTIVKHYNCLVNHFKTVA